jgi:hypothetical protein
MPDGGGVELGQLLIQGFVVPVPEAIAILRSILVSILAALVVPLAVLTSIIAECARCQRPSYQW